MSRVVIKTIKGRQYRYLQRSYRDGDRVRTESLYLGPVGGGRRLGLLRRIGELIEANRAEPGTRVLNQMIDESEKQTKLRAETEHKADQEFYARMHALYGMTKAPANPVPIEKNAPAVQNAPPGALSPTEAPAIESPSAEEGASSVDSAPSE